MLIAQNQHLPLHTSSPAPRVGLVLGAGGPVGHAYHAGLLKALQRVLGWDARGAQLVVGTSAGAQVGALLRAGLCGGDLTARVTGQPLSPQGEAVARHFVRPCYKTPDRTLRRRLFLSDIKYLGRIITRPWEVRPGLLWAAVAPGGRINLTPQIQGLRRIFGHCWPERPLWITAAELGTGRRVVFGHPSFPTTDVGSAVASSGAVPSIVAPIEIGGRRYVDGGMLSATHADMLAQSDVDVVVISSPLSRLVPRRYGLHAELRRLRQAGKTVLLFEPHGDVAKAMGYNPMDITRAARVAQATYDTFARGLSTCEHQLAELLTGQPQRAVPVVRPITAAPKLVPAV